MTHVRNLTSLVSQADTLTQRHGMSTAWTGEMSSCPFPASMEVGHTQWPFSAAFGRSTRQQKDLESIGTWGKKGRTARLAFGVGKVGVFTGKKLPECWTGTGFHRGGRCWVKSGEIRSTRLRICLKEAEISCIPLCLREWGLLTAAFVNEELKEHPNPKEMFWESACIRIAMALISEVGSSQSF